MRLLFLFLMAVLLAGCPRQHSTSWGTSQARDNVDVDVTPAEIVKERR